MYLISSMIFCLILCIPGKLSTSKQYKDGNKQWEQLNKKMDKSIYT